MLYMFYQQDEKSKWLPTLATEREGIAKAKKPALVSVLDVDNSFEEDLKVEEIRALRYQGPLYFDFDAEDIGEASQQFNLFLTNLKARGVDLEMLRLYATGKKGFHIEVPQQLLMGKVPAAGVLHLPHIYKEMAHALYVETLDLRVYSGSRGRMWRCPNVKRQDNGRYKVQITVDEAVSITPESYADLCSSPRNSLPVDTPKLNSELGLLYAQSRDRVEKSMAKIRARKASHNTLERFGGAWPETLKGVLDGSAIKPGTGWNYISMQLAITAAALGISEDQMIADAEGLIISHESDSDRYSSGASRRRDLRSMWRYVSDNPTKEFSVGAIMAMLTPEARANADIGMGEYVPDEVPKTATTQTRSEPDQSAETKPSTPVNTEEWGIRISSQGIFARIDDGYKNICDLGLQNPVVMSQIGGDQTGYELDVTLDGRKRGKKFLPMSALASRGQMNNWTLLMGASMRGTDAQVSILADVFRKTSETTLYAVGREGIDLVNPPGALTHDDDDIIWASPAKVICLREGVNYRFRGDLNQQGIFNSDLMTAPDLDLDDEDYVADLLSINTPGVLGKMLGWFCAAFLTQMIRRRKQSFPSLQIYGQAGAGKSKTVILLNHLHYNHNPTKQFSVSGQTVFPLIAAVGASASIPVIFEEVKRRQLNKNMLDFLQGVLRSNYTADTISRGSLSKDKSVRELMVTEYKNEAPVCFVGEAIEDQSAILERCIAVAMSKLDRMGRDDPFNRCMDDAQRMGRLGKALSLAALAIDRAWLYGRLDQNLADLVKNLPPAIASSASRPVFNLSVGLTGLDFLRGVLDRAFGNRFGPVIETMRSTILENALDAIPRNMSEASRVLDTMAQLTRNEDDGIRLLKGIDYAFGKDGNLELKLRSCYDKYVRYQRSLGMEVLFDSHTAWQMALTNYGGTLLRAVPASVLWDSPKALVFKLSLAYLDDEGVDAFQP